MNSELTGNSKMMLAIHKREGSYSERWIHYCDHNGISYRSINCHSYDVLKQLEGVDGLLWHWTLSEPGARYAARNVLAGAKQAGLRVYPNYESCWHYDDKIAQKYLLESIGAPIASAYVFYDESDALRWIDQTDFPKVFKLRAGAGSQNVRLVRSKGEAIRLCYISFRRGFRATNGYFGDTKTKIKKTGNLNQFFGKLRRMPAALRRNFVLSNSLPREKGYIYFQDYLADNGYDIRITVIGDRAFGFTRATRPHDFRASGSGIIGYDLNKIDLRCVEIAFAAVKKLSSQSMAFDFVFDSNNTPQILEMSYCFLNKAVYDCPGYWDDKINWHSGHIWPEDAILTDFLNTNLADRQRIVEPVVST